jgi:hypothetical protein
MPYTASYRRILHRMGYYNYQQGLIFHHLNQEGGWDNHLKHCREFILKALDFYKPAVVTVLGTGWLLDLPLKEMTERTDLINLVDVLHPPEVKRQVADIKNVVLREDDVTGGLILNIWRKAGPRFILNRLRSIRDIEVPGYQPQFDTGMIISLNIMTQLESLPLAFLKKRSKCTEEDYLNFRREIQSKHLSFLKNRKSVLITDLSEVVTESSGNISEISSVIIDLPEGKYREDWTWDFDLIRSDFYNKRSVFKVSALLY